MRTKEVVDLVAWNSVENLRHCWVVLPGLALNVKLPIAVPSMRTRRAKKVTRGPPLGLLDSAHRRP